jgi:broad specificity phosphatase PhoE
MPPCPAPRIMFPSPRPDTCWLYLLRHGATENNRADPPRLQGRGTDPALSDEGFEQARQTARFLASAPLDVVYSSPLLRARQTAEAIAEPHGLGVQIVDDLTEVDVGDWEGRSWSEIQRTDPEAYQAFMTDATVNPYLGGENLQTVLDRAVPAFQRLMETGVGRLIVALAHNVVNRTYLAHLMGMPAARYLGRLVVAVGHNCVNRAYLAHLLAMPLAKYRSIPQDNCGLNLLRYRDGRVKAITVNGVFHLYEGK